MTSQNTSLKDTSENLAGSPWPSEMLRWDTIALGHLFRVVNGSTPKSDVEEYWNGDIPWATPEDIKDVGDGRIRSTQRTITDEGYKSCGTALLPNGSIILTTRAPIGKLAIAETKLCTNQGCKSLVPVRDLNSRFYYYSLISAREYLEILGEGATFDELGTGDLKGVRLPCPPYRKQKQIASFLDNQTSHIDALVEKNQQLLKLLEERRLRSIEKSVTEGIDEREFEPNERLEVLGKLPSDWKIRRAKTLFSERDDRGYDDLPLLEVSLNHGVRLREENEDRKAWVASDLKTMKRVAPGDLVFNKMRLWQGAIDRSDYEGIVSPDYTVIKPEPEANPAYYAYLLRTEAYKTEVYRRSQGIVDDRLRIYWTQFGDMPLLHPSPAKQAEIVQHIQNSSQQIDELRSKLQTSIDHLKEKRQALITHAITGQIDLSDWEDQEDQELSV